MADGDSVYGGIGGVSFGCQAGGKSSQSIRVAGVPRFRVYGVGFRVSWAPQEKLMSEKRDPLTACQVYLENLSSLSIQTTNELPIWSPPSFLYPSPSPSPWKLCSPRLARFFCSHGPPVTPFEISILLCTDRSGGLAFMPEMSPLPKAEADRPAKPLQRGFVASWKETIETWKDGHR